MYNILKSQAILSDCFRNLYCRDRFCDRLLSYVYTCICVCVWTDFNNSSLCGTRLKYSLSVIYRRKHAAWIYMEETKTKKRMCFRGYTEEHNMIQRQRGRMFFVRYGGHGQVFVVSTENMFSYVHMASRLLKACCSLLILQWAPWVKRMLLLLFCSGRYVLVV